MLVRVRSPAKTKEKSVSFSLFFCRRSKQIYLLASGLEMQGDVFSPRKNRLNRLSCAGRAPRSPGRKESGRRPSLFFCPAKPSKFICCRCQIGSVWRRGQSDGLDDSPIDGEMSGRAFFSRTGRRQKKRGSFASPCYDLGSLPDCVINFFSSDFTRRSSFLRSSSGGRFSGLIPRCPSMSRTL